MKGHLVWWAVPDDVLVAFDKLKSLGLASPPPLQAWQKATTVAALAMREEFEGYRITLRKVANTKKQFLAEVIRDIPDKEKRVITIPLIAAEFLQSGATYEILSTAPNDIQCEAIIKKIDLCYQDALNYADAQDLRRHIRRMLLDALLGAPVRKTGGLYFIPANIRSAPAVPEVLSDIRQALKSSDERIEFSYVRILDDEEAALNDIKKSIFDFLIQELNDLKASSKNLKSPNVRGENKKAALQAAFEKYKTLASRVEVYKETFESNFEVIATALEQTYQDLLDALDALPVSVPQTQDTLFTL